MTEILLLPLTAPTPAIKGLGKDWLIKTVFGSGSLIGIEFVDQFQRKPLCGVRIHSRIEANTIHRLYLRPEHAALTFQSFKI
jgi:hypothetical protein